MNDRRLVIRCLVVVLSVIFWVGCKSPAPSPIIETVTPTPHPEPEVDRSFEDPAKVQSWQAEFAQKVEERLALPAPEKVLGYAKEFKVDPSKLDPFIGDPTVWDSTWTYPVFGATQEKKNSPNTEMAKALEAAGRHWDAAQEWVALGNMGAAKKCAAQLAKRREWKAVALVSVLIGDLENLTNATTTMVKADQITNTKEVVRFAFQKNKMNAAKHVCATHGWEIGSILNPEDIRSLARRGDATLMPILIEQGLNSANDAYGVLADMMIYAKFFPKEARTYISRYLNMSQANVFVWVSCGEGCDTVPVRGSLELYSFVKNDSVLRDLYFERIRRFINEAFPLRTSDTEKGVVMIPNIISGDHMGNYVAWSLNLDGGNILFSYLWKVRQLNDPDLKAFWVGMLDTFPSRNDSGRSLVFEREMGRFVLGLSANAKAEGLSPEERIVLDVFQGRQAPDPVTVYKAQKSSGQDQKTVPDVKWLFDFLTRGSVPTAREAQIRKDLGIPEALQGDADFRYQIRSRLDESIRTVRDDLGWLDSALWEPRQALEKNQRAREKRLHIGMVALALYPDTEQEYQEIVTPSLLLVREKMPELYTVYVTSNPRQP